MTTDDAKKLLEANRDRVAVFISDPTEGDQIVVTQNPVLLPKTHEGFEIDTAGHFLETFDFGIYEGDGPRVTVLPV